MRDFENAKREMVRLSQVYEGLKADGQNPLEDESLVDEMVTQIIYLALLRKKIAG